MSKQPASPLKTLALLVSVMIGGVVIFAAISIVLAGNYGLGRHEADNSFARLLLSVLGVFGLGLLVAYPLVRKTILDRLRAQWRGGQGPILADESLLRSFQTLTIVGTAMAEGFALFATVIYLLTAAPVALAATILGVLTMAWTFPSERRLERFATDLTG